MYCAFKPIHYAETSFNLYFIIDELKSQFAAYNIVHSTCVMLTNHITKR